MGSILVDPVCCGNADIFLVIESVIICAISTGRWLFKCQKPIKIEWRQQGTAFTPPHYSP